MQPEELGAVAVGAILAGTDLSLHLPAGEKWPQGWPRGELLSVTERGRNYSFNPLKVLAFMQRLGKLSNGQAPNVPHEGADAASSRTLPLERRVRRTDFQEEP